MLFVWFLYDFCMVCMVFVWFLCGFSPSLVVLCGEFFTSEFPTGDKGCLEMDFG